MFMKLILVYMELIYCCRRQIPWRPADLEPTSTIVWIP